MPTHAYQAGRYSEREAERLEFVRSRSEAQADVFALQTFSTYLQAIGNPTAFAAQRAVRDRFIDSLLEIASFLGETRLGSLPSLPAEARADITSFLVSLRAHPEGRAAAPVRFEVTGNPADSTALQAELQALAERYGCTLT